MRRETKMMQAYTLALCSIRDMEQDVVYPFAGALDEVRFYSGALTEKEIRWLSAANQGGSR